MPDTSPPSAAAFPPIVVLRTITAVQRQRQRRAAGIGELPEAGARVDPPGYVKALVVMKTCASLGRLIVTRRMCGSR